MAAILAVSWASGKRAHNLGQLRLSGLSVAAAEFVANPHRYIFSLYVGVEKNRHDAIAIKAEVGFVVVLLCNGGSV